ncbi:MAG: hypothetical protein KAT75_04295 [Dehalococcoidia bacterium]|nr:hypothetical protein [Dehalococcoidia bacterium]
MKLDEAIEILEKERHDHHSFPSDVIGQAEGLGIEALKRTIARRERLSWKFEPLLPGETD